MLQCVEPAEDAVSSYQVAKPAHCCSSQASWGPKWRPVTGRQRSVCVAESRLELPGDWGRLTPSSCLQTLIF